MTSLSCVHRVETKRESDVGGHPHGPRVQEGSHYCCKTKNAKRTDTRPPIVQITLSSRSNACRLFCGTVKTFWQLSEYMTRRTRVFIQNAPAVHAALTRYSTRSPSNPRGILRCTPSHGLLPTLPRAARILSTLPHTVRLCADGGEIL